MDTTSITVWSDMVAFPLLTTLTIIPLATMIVVLLLPSPIIALRLGFLSVLVTLLLSGYLITVFDPGRQNVQLFEQFQNINFTYSVGVDGASILFIPLTAVLSLLAFIYLLSTRRVHDQIEIACLLAYEGILIGAFVAMNAMQFWFWCLLELIPVTLMTFRAGSGQNRRWVIGLLLQHWGSGLFMTLMGFLLLAFGVMGSGDTLSFDWLVLKENKATLEYGTLIFFLLFFGFSIRMPLFPFHGWLPVLTEQGTVASAAIYIMGLKIGVYAVIRYILPTLPDIVNYWSWFVLILGLISIFYGALLALMQINIRRLIAYAVISHTGMLIIGVFAYNLYSLEGSLLLSVAFGLATAGLLLSTGMIYKRTHTAYIPRLGGMFEVNAAIAFLFVASALSTMAMPGTPGFDGAHLLIEGTIKKYGWLVSIAILIGNVLTAALLLRAFQQIFIAVPKRTQKPLIDSFRTHSKPSPRNERIIAVVVCSLLIGVGLYTTPWIRMIDQNINAISNQYQITYDAQPIEHMNKDK
ncbi:complex I subunit 4 family protein [Nitrosomonas communis]|uniref:NADH-quinone oxidoreductase subunit M n=1 Tax=Nitrosomonas communis TaxID=44574 RepID=A0A1H2Z327_9PROT|nr:NADH-quinone oxidoreductase subunit M [Nitrosomonas communis]SDX11741.1 NADH-quinone oxidoreductase subunit M [Nitrosomonas communis]